ncbi:HNH endonuclease [Psychrobacillus sp. MER TA 171]|nr:HNH endonuclease [Psychrobacillus sp. MER TA 171]
MNRVNNNKTYTDYKDARDDLADILGWYCSYCEMPVKNVIEVEHIVPIHKGGGKLNWSNFLLSCKYCNTVKNANNSTRSGYVWPDKDNTFRAFEYQYGVPIEAHSVNIAEPILYKTVTDTIKLLGLNREPYNDSAKPTVKDTRWISRNSVWGLAMDSLVDYEASGHHSTVANCISRTAIASGHFSIWMTVFDNYLFVKNLILEAFVGTDISCFDENGTPVARVNGLL